MAIAAYPFAPAVVRSYGVVQVNARAQGRDIGSAYDTRA